MVPGFNWCLALILIFLLASCKPAPSLQPSPPVPGKLGFDDFYTRFHTDSLFQMSHILFPLEGLPEAMDTTRYGEAYYWNKESWHLHHPFNPMDTAFERQFQVIDSTLIREVIVHLMTGYRMERRFSFTGEDWQLIYYSPLRQPVRIDVELLNQ